MYNLQNPNFFSGIISEKFFLCGILFLRRVALDFDVSFIIFVVIYLNFVVCFGFCLWCIFVALSGTSLIGCSGFDWSGSCLSGIVVWMGGRHDQVLRFLRVGLQYGFQLVLDVSLSFIVLDTKSSFWWWIDELLQVLSNWFLVFRKIFKLGSRTAEPKKQQVFYTIYNLGISKIWYCKYSEQRSCFSKNSLVDSWKLIFASFFFLLVSLFMKLKCHLRHVWNCVWEV